MKAQTHRLRTLLRVVSVAAVFLAALSARVVISSRSELLQAQQLRQKGDLPASVVHFRRAARWYVPGSPYHVQALSELAEIAHQAEQRQDPALALTSYRAIRSAIMSIRSFFTPELSRLNAANRRIAELVASAPAPPIDAGKSRETLREEHLALLEAQHGPDIFWTCVLLLGFVAWVGGAFVFSIRAIDEADSFVWTEARRWGTVIVIGFGLFILGMSLA
ncbi:MAG: hypothetical protein JXA30_20650 [Deltaproteobacteria bacterium]|nr:hypothetical protein [Deltaproteobacteria bacterium]